MGKRMLITSTDMMMIQFLVPHVQNLAGNGYEVEIACSDVGGRMEEIRSRLQSYVKTIHTVRLVRSPVSLINLKGYQDMKNVIDSGRFDIIWTNEPVMGVATRLAARQARKQGTKVLYMVHGFHFYRGAPKLNWMLYYPIEKMMASKADVIVTVNREDYQMAKTLQVNRVEYIHGIGINTGRITSQKNKNDIRQEFGLKHDDFIVLSVGELNKNKNQQVIIKALSVLKEKNIHYMLCGKGDQLENLRTLSKKLGLEKNVHFLGYRKNVVEICSQADAFVMPSHREGLPVASLEAMYSGLPLVTSNIRGLVDVMENGVSGYLCDPDDVQAFAKGIKKLRGNEELRKRMAERNEKTVVPFCVENTKQEVLNLMNSL